MSLSLFPSRAAIGVGKTADGREIQVFQTPEFSRALADLYAIVGGGDVTTLDSASLTLLSGFDMSNAAPPPLEQLDAVTVADVATLRAELAEALAQVQAVTAWAGDLVQRLENLESQLQPAAGAPDWEHPGKIGAAAANSATFTTINKITFTQPAVSATFTLASGKTFTVSNTLTLTATDGATLAIGAGGTLGSAAYTSSGTYALLAGSAAQPFSTSALTNAGNLTVGSANGSDYIIKPGNAANTGKLMIQPGGGSGGYGASLVLYSHSNATHPGDIVNSISLSSGGSYRITSGALDSGTTVFTVVGATGATTILGGFGCNGKAAQPAFALAAAATDLPTALTLVNDLRNLCIGNGTGS